MRALALLLIFAAGAASAQENKVVLKDAPGRDKAMQCPPATASTTSR
jgi:hypothetical protein